MIIKQTNKASHSKSVVFCCDRNVVDFAMFITTQILDAEPNPDFDICILTLDASIIDENLVDSRIRVCLLDEAFFAGLMVDDRIPIASYVRLAIPKAFENDYKKVLHLDTDIFLQNASISDLFDAAPEGKSVSGVIDLSQWLGIASPRMERYWHVIGVGHNRYMNAGIIVFDIQACVRENLTERFMESAKKIPEWSKLHPDVPFLHDQTSINATLKGDWYPLSLRWNWATVRFSVPFVEEFQPKILHFVGKTKPWGQNTRPYTKKYLKKQMAVYQDVFKNRLHKVLPNPVFLPPRGLPAVAPQDLAASLKRVPKPKTPIRPYYFLARLRLLPKFIIRRRLQALEDAIQEGRPIWPNKRLKQGK